MMEEENGGEGLPANIGKPARRALSTVGVERLEQLTQWTEKELLNLHGVGPKAVGILKAALREQGLSLASRQ